MYNSSVVIRQQERKAKHMRGHEDQFNCDMVVQLAATFAAKMAADILPRELQDIIERNRNQPNPNICHSHDFVDANEAMYDAWKELTGRDDMPYDFTPWNVAWAIAKSNEFDVERIQRVVL